MLTQPNLTHLLYRSAFTTDIVNSSRSFEHNLLKNLRSLSSIFNTCRITNRSEVSQYVGRLSIVEDYNYSYANKMGQLRKIASSSARPRIRNKPEVQEELDSCESSIVYVLMPKLFIFTVSDL
ncbi:hypothetical protein PoB_005339200 [Plakobranchus ocellatus]|uniref:Uncharacterized protein n=1 Tax=Plakobranchus ocellatus TaxID=259542 RepID=A0AAV4C684_9GAST|nr:hypothetical protein PoB_005339200 [Plakobranchus ocellatus]